MTLETHRQSGTSAKETFASLLSIYFLQTKKLTSNWFCLCKLSKAERIYERTMHSNKVTSLALTDVIDKIYEGN